MTNANHVTFPSADGKATLDGSWYLPTRRATNGAVIVMHDRYDYSEAEPNPAICKGAAGLGLTALSFDFRFVQDHSDEVEGENFRLVKVPEEPYVIASDSEVSDLLGAYNFLESFGKEIKPKRYYLIGKSLGAHCALIATEKGGPLEGAINGVVVLGMSLHDADWNWHRDVNFLKNLTCPVLFIIGEFDPLGPTRHYENLLGLIPVPARIEIIEKAGHSYDYVPVKGEAPLSPEEMEAKRAANLQRVADITLEWLEQQDGIREDLRK